MALAAPKEIWRDELYIHVVKQLTQNKHKYERRKKKRKRKKKKKRKKD
jgi:hypothetical protein